MIGIDRALVMRALLGYCSGGLGGRGLKRNVELKFFEGVAKTNMLQRCAAVAATAHDLAVRSCCNPIHPQHPQSCQPAGGICWGY